MGLVSQLLAPLAVDRGPGSDFWYTPILYPTGTGINVTPESALRASAVHGCVRVIAETLASTPLIIYRRRPDGGKDRATEHPLYEVLHDEPNAGQEAVDWYENGQGHLLLQGNAYYQIIPGPRGFVDQLKPLNPALMTPERLSNGRKRYRYRGQGATEVIFTQDEIFHVPNFGLNGIAGLSPIDLAREGIGLSLAAEGYGSRFFKNDARPGGVLSHPGKLSEPAGKRVARSWMDAHGGFQQAHVPAVLEEGMKWEQVGMTSEAAQFLETRQFQVADIARIFRVPLVLIQETEKNTSWGSGIEQIMIAFVALTMLAWYRRWEQAIRRQLILDKQTYFAEFLVTGLLRGDIKTRYEAYSMGRQWGWLSTNEIRGLENLNPVPGGDTYLTPLNMERAVSADPTLRLIAEEAVGRLVRKESVAVAKAAQRYAGDESGWREWLDKFYGEFAEDLSRSLLVTRPKAGGYAEARRERLARDGASAAEGLLESWSESATEEIMEIALGEVL